MKTLSWTTSEVTYKSNGSEYVKTGWFLCLFNESKDPIATHCLFTHIPGRKFEYGIPNQFEIIEALGVLASQSGVKHTEITTDNIIGMVAEIRHDIAKKISGDQQ